VFVRVDEARRDEAATRINDNGVETRGFKRTLVDLADASDTIPRQ
jgi:hypothetical protein